MKLAQPTPPNATIRLGMVGVAFADKHGKVTKTSGKLSNWLLVGQHLAECSSPLLGMEAALDELCKHPSQCLTLPNISLDQFEPQEPRTISIQWDGDCEQFVICTTAGTGAGNSESDELREFRLRQLLQSRLAEERQHARTLYEQSPHLALCYNHQAQLLTASNNTQKVFLGNDEKPSSLHYQLTQGPIWASIWAGEKLKNHPLEVTDSSGELRQLELSGYLITPPNMLSQEAHYSLVDVTERNSYRLHMQKRSEALEANKRLSSFAALTANELLAPFRRIASFTQILTEEAEKSQSESVRFALQAIQRSTERGQALVNDVVYLTQKASRAEQLESLNPSELLKTVVEGSGLLLEQAQATIRYSGSESLIMADAELLRTVYRNLLSNAIKFRAPHRPLEITHTVTDTGTGYIRIEFKDNGVGFDPKHTIDIFKPFTRLAGEDSVESAELGLAIAKEAATAMGCHISACSEPNMGTTIALIASSSSLN